MSLRLLYLIFARLCGWLVLLGRWWRTYFDPGRYSVTLFDQRGCGRSRPLARMALMGAAGNAQAWV